MIDQIRLWHAEACQLVFPAAVKAAPFDLQDKQPAIDFCQSPGFWGYYTPHTHICHYDLGMARMRGNGYRDTVIHEVCHAYREMISRPFNRDGHDDVWAAIMEAIGQDPKSRCALPSLAGMYAQLQW